MKQLMNISTYAEDLSRFDNSWKEVEKFCKAHDLAGVELLIGGEHTKTVPKSLVQTVHLPGWLGWVRLWKEPHTALHPSDEAERLYYYGASSPDELISVFRDSLMEAAFLSAAYAVFHITHVELDEFYTRSFRYTTTDVLTAAASFLNAVCQGFPGGEPPVTLGLENLWWPGLTFSSRQEVDLFSSLLRFKNWHYVLDTGHLMNYCMAGSEQEGIAAVIRYLSALGHDTLRRIKAVHLQCSVSGQFQKEYFYQAPPAGFSELSYSEKIGLLIPLVGLLDQHRAFSDQGCRDIVDLIRPEYLVHEFVTRSRDELDANLTKQRKTLGYR